MKALVFGVDPDSIPEVHQAGDSENPLLKGLAATPMSLIEVEDPKPIGPDWVENSLLDLTALFRCCAGARSIGSRNVDNSLRELMDSACAAGGWV